MQRADKAPGLAPITVPLHKHWPWPVYSSLDIPAKHHPVLAERTGVTHINTLIINTSPGHRSTLGPSQLKEICAVQFKMARGREGEHFFFFHKHVPISSTVNNSNANGRGVAGREGEDRWKVALGAMNEGSSCPPFNVSASALAADRTRLITGKRTRIRRTGCGC